MKKTPRPLLSLLRGLTALAASCGGVAKSQMIKPERLHERGTALRSTVLPPNFMVVGVR